MECLILSICFLTTLLIISYYLYYFCKWYYTEFDYKNYNRDFYNKYTNISLNNVLQSYESNKQQKTDKNVINVTVDTSQVIIFFSLDYKVLPKYYNIVLKNITDYCTLHNYTLIIFDHYNDKDKISPYWYRVRDFIKLSSQYDDDTIFMYLDLDVCVNPKYNYLSINNMINAVDDIEKNTSDIYIGNNLGSTTNAGVIIIRNTNWSKIFLNVWWNKYNPQYWNFDAERNKWVCRINDKKCIWARNGYEQGEFNKMYENNELNSQDRIKILHYSLVSSNEIQKDNFIYHFYGYKEKDKLKNIEYILTK